METNVEGDGDEVVKKREEVAAKLMACAPDGVLDVLDASLDYGRCQSMYDHVVSNVDKLLHQCETATLYLERLRKSLPVQQLMQLGLKEQEAVWAWCDLEEHVAPGVVCFSIGNAGHTSDEYQLRSPPFYALNVPWTLRLYKAKAAAGQDTCFMAAYLDAGNALRIDSAFEKEVCSCSAVLVPVSLSKERPQGFGMHAPRKHARDNAHALTACSSTHGRESPPTCVPQARGDEMIDRGTDCGALGGPC